MKLAVRKDEGSIPGGGYHYMLMPVKLGEDVPGGHPAIWEQMGHVIIEVSEERGEALLKAAGAALQHQMDVAVLTEKQLRENSRTLIP